MPTPETLSRIQVDERDESPLASLSRTLESLESRLSRLPAIGSRNTAEATRRTALQSSTDQTSPALDRRRPGGLADAVSEIVMRRRMLDEMAERPAVALARPAPSRALPVELRPSGTRPPAAAPLVRRLESLASEAEALNKEDGNLRLMAEVAAEIQKLREEMQGEGRPSFEGRFDELREAFDQLRQMIEDRESAETIGAELQEIAASLARLTEAGADRSTLNSMRSELEEFRHLSRLAARETTVQAVGDRWETFENRYTAKADEDIAAKAELKRELERLRESLRSLAREDQVQAVERRWDAFEERYRDAPNGQAISETIREELGGMRAKLETLSDSSPQRAVEAARWNELEKRLDRREEGIQTLSERMGEIESKLTSLPNSLDVSSLEERIRSLAVSVDALSRRSEEADVQNFLSLEERLDEISRAIVASMPLDPPVIDMAPIERIEARIASLTGRVDELGNDGKVERLSRRIVDLSARVEDLARNPTGVAAAERIEALADRFETAFAEFEPQRIDAAAIEKRMGFLAERFEMAIAGLEAPTPETGDIERRLTALTGMLESAASEPRLDTAVMRSLETQIERLSDNLTRVGTLHEDFETDIDARLVAIEQRLDGDRETLIHTAREVAEETARRMQAFGDQRQAEHVSKLSENLLSLEALSRESDGRSNKVFEAVHMTLLKIVDRLEQIETEIASPVREAAAADSFHPRVFERQEATATAAAAATAAAPSEIGVVERAREVVASTRTREEIAAPTIDAADMIDRDEMNRPLEPGSGMPDIGALLERVRAAQRNKTEGAAESAGGEAETRAAARKAAWAASAEAEKLRAPAATGESQGLKGLIARRRKAILTGVVAVIVALSALPIGKSFLGKDADGNGNVSNPVAEAAPVSEAPVPGVLPAATAVETAAPERNPDAAAVPAAAAPDPVPESPAATPSVSAPPPGDAAAAPPVDAPAHSVDSSQVDPETLMARLKTRLPASALQLPPMPEGIGTGTLSVAARTGDPKAAFEIGLRLMEGRSGEPKPQEALNWFAQAATKGFAPAQYSIGTLYEKGNGIARDMEAARDWYTLAAQSGNIRAMHNLAVLYATGIDGRSQPETAARWFVDAADHGMRDSQYNLGILYARGSGVPQDLVQSYKWFGVVADSGDNDAAAKRDEVAKSMTPEQLKTAQDAVRSFSPAPRVELANTVDTPADWQDPKTETTSSVDMTKAIRNIQAILGKLGYDVGTPDGRMGDKTKVAIAAFQKDNNLKATGEIDGPLIRTLLQRKDG